jgi:hypothetical protein
MIVGSVIPDLLGMQATLMTADISLWVSVALFWVGGCFNQDLIRLVRDGAYGAAALSFGVTAVGCIVAGLLGFGLAQKTVGH